MKRKYSLIDDNVHFTNMSILLLKMNEPILWNDTITKLQNLINKNDYNEIPYQSYFNIINDIINDHREEDFVVKIIYNLIQEHQHELVIIALNTIKLNIKKKIIIKNYNNQHLIHYYNSMGILKLNIFDMAVYNDCSPIIHYLLETKMISYEETSFNDNSFGTITGQMYFDLCESAESIEVFDNACNNFDIRCEYNKISIFESPSDNIYQIKHFSQNALFEYEYIRRIINEVHNRFINIEKYGVNITDLMDIQNRAVNIMSILLQSPKYVEFIKKNYFIMNLLKQLKTNLQKVCKLGHYLNDPKMNLRLVLYAIESSYQIIQKIDNING